MILLSLVMRKEGGNVPVFNSAKKQNLHSINKDDTSQNLISMNEAYRESGGWLQNTKVLYALT